MTYPFPPIEDRLAGALAAIQTNIEEHKLLTAQREVARAELGILESGGQNTEETASQIATKRIALDLFERDIKQSINERPALHRALADAFGEFRRTSASACEDYRSTVVQKSDAAARKAREPFVADLDKANAFSSAHADSNYNSTDLETLLKHAPKMLAAWNELKGATS